MRDCAALDLLLRNEAASGSALDDEKFIEPAFQCAIEEGNAFGGGQADQFRHAGVTRQYIGAPSGESLLQPIAEFGIEQLEFFRSAEAYSVGRVYHHHSLVRRGFEIENIALLQTDIDGHSCALKRPLRELHHRGIMVGGIDGGRHFGQLFVAGCFAQVAPTLGIVDEEPLEPEIPRNARRDLAAYQGGFEWDSSAPAHGIEQDFLGCPAGQSQQPGGQIFSQRRFD